MSFHWTITRKLQAMTVLMLLLLTATSGFGILGMSRMHDGFRAVTEDTTPALIHLSGTVDALHRIRVRVIGAAMETDSARIAALRDEYVKQLADLNKTWNAYAASRLSPEEAALAREAETGIKSYQGFIQESWARIAAGEANGVLADLVGGKGVDKFREAATPLRKLLDFQSREAATMFAEGEQNYDRDRSASLGLVGLGLVLGFALSALIGRSVARPIHRIIAVMGRLAANDTQVEVTGQDRGDEVGEIARAVQVFKLNALEKGRLEAEAQENKRLAESRHHQEMKSLAADFESGVSVVVDKVAGASAEMEHTAQALSTLSEQVAVRAEEVAGASEHAAANVETVAAATEELAASVAEIGRQVSESARVARDAVDEAAQANTIVHGLSEATKRIGEVVTMITDIAAQTNLLALNATIEAARAGEAGKGFAVVAGEVKNLANQTARATDEISQQIASVQAETGRAVDAIRGVGTTIGRIDEISAAIASAVEEQGAATREIARNVEEAAQGTQSVSGNIAGVTSAARDTGQASATVLASATELAAEAHTLRRIVQDFVAKVRAS
ncbi:methyl-accepting chemotaxis protein [Paramagnetospirillum magneticum]|uniref:Methyl-accepting chemotaxis protein n=1 Tax=Paramagnetospirillum magneticum (strain ATCC 700264 / AMB-1) TaxID=342108 RepID=Q2W0C0_PARM1|nr:methyl-accepting chemotaxis protein [Paramagnetospirillum magneticum]BAE52705.1 Methyl-accepting chemotaxis protein [Paramagnetospirillum magneticum AMB-1]